MKGFQKIVTPSEMGRIEKKAFASGSNEELFILEAGKKVALQTVHYIAQHQLPKKVLLLVGKGNNGADAWAAGARLKEEGFEVHAYPVFHPEVCSSLNQKMRHLFIQKKGIIENQFRAEGVILDGLLGTGFKGKLDPKIEAVIEQANHSKKPILAIDIPSGLDGATGEARGAVIRAAETITLGFPKSGFFQGEGWNFVGQIRVEEFGLSDELAKQAKPFGWMATEAALKPLLPPVVRTRHKYQAGYVVGVGGSKELPGAVKLAGMGALRGGAGIVRLFSLEEIGETPFELIWSVWKQANWEKEMERASALFIGPGLGSKKKSHEWLQKHLKTIKKKCVIDADALQPGYRFPKGAILTPHHGEALRLLKLKSAPKEMIDECQSFAEKHDVVMVLKGAPTFVLTKEERIVIPFGDPGMATAGSGDVLTGLLGALLAQGLAPIDAAVLGASLHGMAGEAIAAERTSYGMVASDLIDNLYQGFLRLMHTQVNSKIGP